MEIKIKVKTPVGQAKLTSGRIGMKALLFTTKAKIKDTFISPEDDMFIWVVDVPVRNYPKVQRNVAAYASMVQATLRGVTNNKHIKKKMDEGYEEELNAMFKETTVEIMKEADVQELVDELSKETFWQRVKSKWNNIKGNGDKV